MIRFLQSVVLWGFLGGDGAWVIKPAYEKTQKGNDGRFPVMKGSKLGVVDPLGNTAIKRSGCPEFSLGNFRG